MTVRRINGFLLYWVAITALKFGISRRQFVLADTNGIVLTEPDEQAYVLRSWNGHGMAMDKGSLLA